MSEGDPIVRIAARGDGLTAGGKHVAGGMPGDVLLPDGSLQFGPHHADPPCRHFGKCGGCQLQHADEAAWREFVTRRVLDAADGHDISPAEVLETYCSPPGTRRRATLHGVAGKGAALGFREEKSHKIVDLRECPVLLPQLAALVGPLRKLLGEFRQRGSIDCHLAVADQGIVCEFAKLEVEGLQAIERLQDFAREHGLARLSVDQGYGPELHWEPEPVTVSFNGVAVRMPHKAFLQPTLDGEAQLVTDVAKFLDGAGAVADLFAGLGTFTFGLKEGRKLLAAEGARDAHAACLSAARSSGLEVAGLHRDLFRNPLTSEECSRFDAVVLDPPRAGAREQVAQLAGSSVGRIAYVSCNPSSWARDARTLVDAGYRLAKLRPVGQFRWSTHVELTSLFER